MNFHQKKKKATVGFVPSGLTAIFSIMSQQHWPCKACSVGFLLFSQAASPEKAPCWLWFCSCVEKYPGQITQQGTSQRNCHIWLSSLSHYSHHNWYLFSLMIILFKITRRRCILRQILTRTGYIFTKKKNPMAYGGWQGLLSWVFSFSHLCQYGAYRGIGCT